MRDFQNFIKHQESRQDQDEIDAHENWLISEEIKTMKRDNLEKMRDWFIKKIGNIIPL